MPDVVALLRYDAMEVLGWFHGRGVFGRSHVAKRGNDRTKPFTVPTHSFVHHKFTPRTATYIAF